MSHGQPHEEAEHAAHHAVDPFDKRVAMSMVVIAALLAGVKVLGHRAHTDTLSYQIKANVNHTQGSDKWNYFQAKKNRQYLYEAQADLLTYLGRKSGAAPVEFRDEEVAAAPKEKPKTEKKKKSELTPEDEKEVALLEKKGLPRDSAERIVTWRSQVQTYKAEAAALQTEAEGFDKAAEAAEKQSEHKHHQSFYFDMGELFVELAIVLCSVAILTKQKSFWYGGMAVCLFGLFVFGAGFFVH